MKTVPTSIDHPTTKKTDKTMKKQNLQESAPAKTSRQSATKNRIGLQRLYPRLLTVTLILFASFTTLPYYNQAEAASTEEENSALPIIAWFNERDTMTYWISESNWKFEGTDTVKTLGANTKVKITVTDSTKDGYQMEYKFLKFSTDTDAESKMQDFMQETIQRLQDEIVGTTIRFRTDEMGKIIQYDNLEEVEKQAKRVFDGIIQESSWMDKLNSTGIKADELFRNIDPGKLVQSYTEELEMLFQYHGYQFPLKETTLHEEATDTKYESDTYLSATIDPEDYEYYEIIIEINNYIPRKDIKQLLGGLVDMLMDEEDATTVKEDMNTGFDEQVTGDAVSKEILHMRYFPDGWPEEVISQQKIIIGNKGKMTQKYITWDERSVNNSD